MSSIEINESDFETCIEYLLEYANLLRDAEQGLDITPDDNADYVFAFVSRLQEIEAGNTISIEWSIEDVLMVAPDLTEEEAKEVLKRVEHGHDATLGVTWETLEFHADMVREERSSD